MCGGFACSKNALSALNIMYIMVAVVLISVAVYGRTVTNLPIIGGILACGVFLFIIAIAGLYGAAKHNQVVLFFYMIILFLLFLIQFSIACACLAVSNDQQVQLAEQGWAAMDLKTRTQIQETVHCCGVYGRNDTVRNASDPLYAPTCSIEANCCRGGHIDELSQCDCPPCMDTLKSTISYAFKLCGGIGLFFSFTEIVAVIVAYRYRNLYDPMDKLLPAAHIPRDYLY